MKKDDNYYKGLDKRTTEYKNWAKFNKIANESQGVGDTIEKITKATGIKKVVKKLFGEDCGCEERKEKLNKLLPYRRKAKRCLQESQYKEYQEYKKTRHLNVWNEKEIELLIRLYAHVFAIQYSSKDLCRNCSGSGKLLLRMSNELDKIVDSYEL